MRGARGGGAGIALALAITWLVWGSTYLGIRYAIETLPPLMMAGTRFFTAGLLVYGWQRWRGTERPSGRQWRNAAIAGALLLAVGNGGVTWVEQYVTSGMAALVVATTPLWMVLLAWALPGGTRPKLAEGAGLALGMAGVGLLVVPSGEKAGIAPFAAGVLLIASLSFAAGSLFTRSADLPKSKFLTAGMEMTCAGVLLIGMGLARGEAQTFDPAAVSATSVIAFVYLFTFGSLIAFSAYVWLLGAAPPALAGTYAFVNPAVAVLLGWGIAGEPIGGSAVTATTVIVAGVALITLARNRRGSAVTVARLENAEVRQAVVDTPRERACAECG